MKVYFLTGIYERIIFFILLLLISYLYNYHNIAFFRPQSVHNWRQSDCASLALNYYQNGMKFFQPETHNLTSKNFTSGKAATSEIPFLYFFVAILYKIFGYHDYIYRILNTIIFLSGIYSLFRMLSKLKLNFIWSLTFSLIFFTSPVLVYYGNNYLTDITALSLTFIAWNYFISYYQSLQKKFFWISMLFFFLAMSMKISAGISVVALFCIYILDTFKIITFKKEGKLFPERIIQLIPFVFIFLVVSAWAYYARVYNTKNDTFYFSTTLFPIWKMSNSYILGTVANIKALWLNQYFHKYTLILFLLLFLYNVLFINKTHVFLMTLNMIVFAGTVLFSFLWFENFGIHDYYTINLFILLAISALTFSETINKQFPKAVTNIFVRGSLLAFLIFNIYYAKKEMSFRYDGWWNEYPKFKDFYTITPYLRSLGITRHDTVISIPDQSHHTLYLMNQPGWTECFGQNRDSAGIARSVQHGAKYLMMASHEDLDSRPYVRPFISDTIGQYNNVIVFKLRNF
jgi:hypothetical protein